jgi:hypothetical protein
MPDGTYTYVRIGFFLPTGMLYWFDEHGTRHPAFESYHKWAKWAVVPAEAAAQEDRTITQAEIALNKMRKFGNITTGAGYVLVEGKKEKRKAPDVAPAAPAPAPMGPAIDFVAPTVDFVSLLANGLLLTAFGAHADTIGPRAKRATTSPN